MIEVQKAIHGVDKVCKKKLFSPSQNTRTRVYLMQLDPGRNKANKGILFLHNM